MNASNEPNTLAAAAGESAAPTSPEALRTFRPHAARGRLVRFATVLVALAIALSSFLLFAIELIVGRLVLPVFGGAPAAWATVLVFFQGVLLLGYLYGHLSTSRLGPRPAAAVHVAPVSYTHLTLPTNR